MQVLADYKKFLSGDKDAFNAVTEKFAKVLSLYAYKRVKRRDIAEDVMMDTLMELVIKKRWFTSEEHLTAFLYQVARNKCIDALRRAKKYAPLEEGEVYFTYPEERQNSEKYDLAMQKIPKLYQEVLQLTFEEGLSVEEIAIVLKKSKKQIYNVLYRAKNSFQNYYGELK